MRALRPLSSRTTHWLVLAAWALAASAAHASDTDLLELSQRADKADRQSLQSALAKADACTQARDFACAEAQLAKAARFARNSKDDKLLAGARQSLSGEQQRAAEEARREAQEAENQRLAKQAAEERARASEEGSGTSTAAALLQMTQMAVNNYAQARANAPRTAATLPLADLSGGKKAAVGGSTPPKPVTTRPGTGSPDPLAVMNQLIAGHKPGVEPRNGNAPTGVPRSEEVWVDNYSNREVATGRTKSFPAHESNIPGDVMATKMRSEADAMATWGPQGAKSARYQGCGACGVGSKIVVVVDFGYIVDTHEYVRIK